MHEETYWQAVMTRDSSSNGIFVYGVRSTGIYCNPSCPSRRPKREQVVFFPLPEVAEQAGFRPCRRCHPQELRAGDPQIELVREACRYIERHLENPPNLSELSEHVHLSPFHLQRVFKRIMGISPRQYAEAYRLGQLKVQLKEGGSVTNALYDVGYGSSSRLYERTPSQLGMTPGAYRRGGLGMRISYTLVESPLGRLLVAATEKGICHISMGDSDAALEATLFQEYPVAEIARDDVRLLEWVTALLSHLNGSQPHLDLPLDIQATAFQWRVWQALQAIPYGDTRSYSEVARTIGEPKAARAVARACATNPVPLVIPCHRVVREDGSSGGYRYGVERKQQLLEREARGGR
ncbi:MAG TPA: bifunctional DNA-binding transcriptional regulator/O6-methylguanine-DNA methyltransferase Ada [Ktedonobacteraceae bacterium]|nr:bifunctional DNA-binding transcriptional regulator/O6-methylguanine-DNA methyltransferase Ada [Ktedonobacteraceae bacterium]